MADKEATVYIIDLGSSMADCNNGRTESDLDWAMRYVGDKIAHTVQAGRKTWNVGVVGLRTDETNNPQSDENEQGYENISILQPLSSMTMSSMRELLAAIKPSETMGGDAISAIVVATEMIAQFTRQLKYKRRIILVTDGLGQIEDEDLDEISARINEVGIELVVLGVDFDDPDYGFKEEDKSSAKKENEELLKRLLSSCQNGMFGTMAEAVEQLAIPRLKPIKLVKNFDGFLTIGDPEKYESAISIHVERYPKTKVNRPPSTTTVVLRSENGTQSTQTLGGSEMEDAKYEDGGFISVRQNRNYRINDPTAPGGKRDVEYESLAKGYAYGSTAVAISESDWNITKLETKKSFSIVGFIPNDRIDPMLHLGEAWVTVARQSDKASVLALSSLIHALYELESYAVARFVVKDGKDPVLLLLMPGIEPDLECLYDVALPFAEDVRPYTFPPLDRVITISGNTLTKHRLLPDDKLNQAMSDFVDAMDISTYDVNEDGEPAEWAAIEDSYSPMIHRINQVIRARAVRPDSAVEDVPQNLLRFSHPPDDLVRKQESKINALISIAQVKKVPERAKGKRQQETAKTISGIDVDAELDRLGRRKRAKISKENAIPEFKQQLRAEETVSESDIENLAKQMGQIVRSIITDSTGDSGYDRAAENIRIMREEMIKFERPDVYNDFLRDLKKRMLSGELGGDRREMWTKKIRWARNIGLIDQKQSEASDVTEEEAHQFLNPSK